MSWGDFNRPSAKAGVNSLISHNRYYPVHRGEDDLFTYYCLEPLVFRAYGYGGITEYCFWSGGSYGNKILIAFSQMVADIV
ncbi:hypothetical protein ES703_122734 [subsurface metagenome]